MIMQQNVVLAPYTSWLIGGPAEYFCQPETENELEEALLWSQKNKKQWVILGGGSNVLIADAGVKGLVISMRKFSKLEVAENAKEIVIRCLAGTTKSELLKVFLKYKLAPALFLAGLPGDVGGGVVMNAGVSENMVPREFGEIVRSFEVWSLEEKGIERKKFGHDQIQWKYRHSEGWGPGVVAKVELAVENLADPQILEKVKNANRVRLQKQPLDMPSCGSVFKNPDGYKAAQLIDSCGLKGTQIGQAQISLKHANFIVNLGNATAQDTWNLILQVQHEVFAKTQVRLKTEVIRLGW